MKYGIFINLPRFKFVKKNTPYPVERDCAHLMIECEEYQSWMMIHAFIMRRGKVKRYAWLQKGSTIFDAKTNKLHKKEVFIKRNKPINMIVYSFKEVRKNMKKFRRYGRWEI